MKSRGFLSMFFAFGVGLPAGLALAYAIHNDIVPLDPQIKRYFHHEIELATLVMFCCGLGALLGKFFASLNERSAIWRRLIAAWDGQPHPVGEARTLREQLERQPGRVRNTYLGRRVAAILDFVESRGTANELDDQIRTLSDNDLSAMEGSYALVRLITWAMPIFGFLGTVLGITAAIQNVSPQALENEGITGVTQALSTAFDATALGLSAAVVMMFLTYVIERIEEGVLDRVDHFVDIQLTHRFERNGTESGLFVEALRQNTNVLLKATQQLVENQASVWAKSLQKADVLWNETGQQQQEQIAASLTDALDRTLTSHTNLLTEMDKKMLVRGQEVFAGIAERSQAMFDGLNALAAVLRETGRQHQATLGELSEKIAGQTQSLTKLQDGEVQLLRLQEVIQQNLTTLAGSGAFEQAVHSLTAAIHLLTTRAGSVQPTTGPRLSSRAA